MRVQSRNLEGRVRDLTIALQARTYRSITWQPRYHGPQWAGRSEALRRHLSIGFAFNSHHHSDIA